MYSILANFSAFAVASAAALDVVTFPAPVVCTKLSSNRGATRSALFVRWAWAHWFSNAVTAFSVAPVLACDQAAVLTKNGKPTTPQNRFLFFIDNSRLMIRQQHRLRYLYARPWGALGS